MTQSANWQLQQAIYDALINNADLLTLLGGGKIYDLVPRHTKPPYITLGITRQQDWSTSTESGHEHLFTLHIWASNQGRKQADEIQAKAEAVIEAAPLSMTDHILVNLVYQFSQIRRDPDGETMHGITRYRVTTEPLV